MVEYSEGVHENSVSNGSHLWDPRDKIRRPPKKRGESSTSVPFQSQPSAQRRTGLRVNEVSACHTGH